MMQLTIASLGCSPCVHTSCLRRALSLFQHCRNRLCRATAGRVCKNELPNFGMYNIITTSITSEKLKDHVFQRKPRAKVF